MSVDTTNQGQVVYINPSAASAHTFYGFYTGAEMTVGVACGNCESPAAAKEPEKVRKVVTFRNVATGRNIAVIHPDGNSWLDMGATRAELQEFVNWVGKLHDYVQASSMAAVEIKIDVEPDPKEMRFIGVGKRLAEKEE